MTRLFTRKEVEARSRPADAAIIIDNVVYDVAKFVEDHPGGPEVLLNNAGQDASRCFHDVGHSDDARLWRAEFKIGEVVPEERWEVLTRDAAPDDDHTQWTLRGLLDVLVPPLGLAALAIWTYVYVL